MWKWYILTAVGAEILQVTSFWLRGNMCTQYMYVKVNYLAGCWCWTTSRMIVIPPRGYLHSIQVKITYFASSWYEQCMFDLLGHCVTFQEHYLTILQHCLTFQDHSLTFLEHCLTFYEHCLTSWVHHWTFQEHCLTFLEHCLTFQEHHFMMFWFHIPDSYEYDWTEISWTSFGICLELQNETGEHGRPFNLFLNESISHWGVTCLVLQDGCNDECSNIFHGFESIAG